MKKAWRRDVAADSRAGAGLKCSGAGQAGAGGRRWKSRNAQPAPWKPLTAGGRLLITPLGAGDDELGTDGPMAWPYRQPGTQDGRVRRRGDLPVGSRIGSYRAMAYRICSCALRSARRSSVRRSVRLCILVRALRSSQAVTRPLAHADCPTRTTTQRRTLTSEHRRGARRGLGANHRGDALGGLEQVRHHPRAAHLRLAIAGRSRVGRHLEPGLGGLRAADLAHPRAGVQRHRAWGRGSTEPPGESYSASMPIGVSLSDGRR